MEYSTSSTKTGICLSPTTTSTETITYNVSIMTEENGEPRRFTLNLPLDDDDDQYHLRIKLAITEIMNHNFMLSFCFQTFIGYFVEPIEKVARYCLYYSSQLSLRK